MDQFADLLTDANGYWVGVTALSLLVIGFVLGRKLFRKIG